LINFPRKQDKLKSIPIVEQAYFLLNTFDTPNGLKLTETGNLNRKVVHAFSDKFLNLHERTFSRPSRELECPALTKIKFLLQDSGYSKVYKGKMHLTKKGTAILQSHSSFPLYRDLLDSA